MASFRDPDFTERRNTATKAKKAALQKFRDNAADPAFAQRQTAWMESAAGRAASKKAREAEKAEKRALEAEAAKQAERDAAERAERALAENADRERVLEAERKAARDARYAARNARSKRR